MGGWVGELMSRGGLDGWDELDGWWVGGWLVLYVQEVVDALAGRQDVLEAKDLVANAGAELAVELLDDHALWFLIWWVGGWVGLDEWGWWEGLGLAFFLPCNGRKHWAVTMSWLGREGLACRLVWGGWGGWAGWAGVGWGGRWMKGERRRVSYLASTCSLLPSSGEKLTMPRRWPAGRTEGGKGTKRGWGWCCSGLEEDHVGCWAKAAGELPRCRLPAATAEQARRSMVTLSGPSPHPVRAGGEG